MLIRNDAYLYEGPNAKEHDVGNEHSVGTPVQSKQGHEGDDHEVHQERSIYNVGVLES